MKEQERILIVLHDAGGAAAVAPLVPELKKSYECRIFAHVTAGKELQSYRFEPHSFFTPEEAEAIIETYRPSLILTGTSMYGESIDRVFIAAARKKHIPSLAVLDYWLNYRKRFTDGSSDELSFLPDKIAVMNKDAKEEMIAEGIPEKIITITGSPRFEALNKQINTKVSDRKKIAKQYDLDISKTWLFFLSESLTADFGGDAATRETLGYTEKDAIDCLVSAIHEKNLQVIVRLHPREEEANQKFFKSIPAAFIQDVGLKNLFSAADLVAGISTVALIDAWLMKKPVISIQPHQKGLDLCYLTRCGLIPKCESAEDIAYYLTKTLNKENFIDYGSTELFNSDASENLLALIKSMIK